LEHCKACFTVWCHGLYVFGPPHGLFIDLLIPATTARLQQPTNCIPYADGLLRTPLLGQFNMKLKEQSLRREKAIKMETKVNKCEYEGKLWEVRRYGDHNTTKDWGRSK
jgi:hypothetical protein